MEKRLYLIALVPPEDLRNQVRELKEEMKNRFEASHALKSPAHITLQKPFRRPDSEEAEMSEILENFAERQHSFPIELQGFGSFSPRVIFVKIKDHEPIEAVHHSLQNILAENLQFSEKELMPKIHPHMTIATRDLKPRAFQNAWPEFRQREFQSRFEAKSLHLLKHNGKTWDFHKEFFFGKH